MSDSEYEIKDENTALLSFKKWLASARYLPNDIGSMINISVSFHVLPLGDITYEYENKWSATIGTFQKEKYQKECDKIKQNNQINRNNGKISQQEEYPNKKDSDYWTWSFGQGTHYNTFNLTNRTLFSFENLLEEQNVITQFINKYSDSFFNVFPTESLKIIQTIQEIPDIDIVKMYFNRCKEHAVNTTKYPGDDQRDIENNVEVLGYSVQKKYLPIYIFDYNFKNKKYINCCDAITADYFTGSRPHANYFDEILMGIIGTISFATFLIRGYLPIEDWAYDLSIQSSTLEIVFLIFGIVGLGYVVLSFVYEVSKASLRRDEINLYGDIS